MSKHTVTFTPSIEERVRAVRAQLIAQGKGSGTLSDAVCWLIATGYQHREEIFLQEERK